MGTRIGKRAMAGLVGAIALTVVAVFGPATSGTATAQPPTDEAPPVCGYFEDDGQAFFHNCTIDGRFIQVFFINDTLPSERCVMPGVTLLGGAPPIRDAHFTPEVLACG